MYALVDCNSFFCSVEKVFHPGLNGRPVVVLSNNDGCIVALTPEAKRIGLHRGDPIFKVQDIVRRYGVHVFSTNMQLYAAMSKRVTNIMRKTVQHVEQYSIDESFLNLSGYERHHDLTEFMRSLAQRIRLFTDIPVSVGIAPSKTLAKMGSKFAKQYRGYNSVCAIDTEGKRRKALELFELSDVWGIGRHTLERLNYYGIGTPLELADKSESWVKTHLAKPGQQTWLELNGIPCIDTHEVTRNKTVCTSHSFGEMIGDLPSLKSSIATFASSCANKLRGQGCGCRKVTVFVSSNPFRSDLPQYSRSATTSLCVPTADTLEITHAALSLVESLYVPGIMYKRSGVIVSDIQPITPLELDFFDDIPNRPQRAALMQTIDALNQRYGLKTVRLSVEGGASQAWKVKCEHRTPNHLTSLAELLVVR